MQLTDKAKQEWSKNMNAVKGLFSKLTADIATYKEKHPEHAKLNDIDVALFFSAPEISPEQNLNDFAAIMAFSAYLNGMLTFASFIGHNQPKHLADLLNIFVYSTLHTATYCSALSIIATLGKATTELTEADLDKLGINPKNIDLENAMCIDIKDLPKEGQSFFTTNTGE